MSLILVQNDPPVVEIALNDPERRNALGAAMMEQLEAALEQIAHEGGVHVVLLRGEGPAFCAGFDLSAAVASPPVLEQFILQLSRLCRQLRRMPQVVIAAAHGAAIAGGCALISACDFVFVTRDVRIGYPVHRIGISPAVSAPTLVPTIGAGAGRALQLSGELIDGPRALDLGLASHLVDSSERMLEAARAGEDAGGSPARRLAGDQGVAERARRLAG